jgi:hypothetical protein
MMDNSYVHAAYEDGKKEAIVQLIERWLPLLPYRSIWAAIWSLRDEPCVGAKRAVAWIRQYCHQIQYACYENVDIQCAYLPEGADVVPGELLLLEGQHLPSENGIYLYTGEGGPLIRDN